MAGSNNYWQRTLRSIHHERKSHCTGPGQPKKSFISTPFRMVLASSDNQPDNYYVSMDLVESG